MQRETKAFQVKVEEKDGGSIIGYASTFDRVPDAYGDVIAPGAFADSLKSWEESGLPIPFLFGHRTDDPFMNIGAVTKAEEDERGLKFEAQFDPESETAQYCRKLALEGRIHQFSFAFEILDAAPVELENGETVRELRKLNLFEISLVPIPANSFATVEDVKQAESNEKDGADDDLAEIREQIEDLALEVTTLKLKIAELEQQQGDTEEEGDLAEASAGKGAPVLERISKYL